MSNSATETLGKVSRGRAGEAWTFSKMGHGGKSSPLFSVLWTLCNSLCLDPWQPSCDHEEPEIRTQRINHV